MGSGEGQRQWHATTPTSPPTPPHPSLEQASHLRCSQAVLLDFLVQLRSHQALQPLLRRFLAHCPNHGGGGGQGGGGDISWIPERKPEELLAQR